MFNDMKLDPDPIRGADADDAPQPPTAPHACEGMDQAHGLFGPHTHVLRSADGGRQGNDDCLAAVITDLSPRAVQILTRSPIPAGERFRLILVPARSGPSTHGPQPLVVAEYRALRCEEMRAGAGEFAVVGTLLRTTGWQGNATPT